MLSVVFINDYAECHFAECHYAECRHAKYHYDECRGAMPNVCNIR